MMFELELEKYVWEFENEKEYEFVSSFIDKSVNSVLIHNFNYGLAVQIGIDILSLSFFKKISNLIKIEYELKFSFANVTTIQYGCICLSSQTYSISEERDINNLSFMRFSKNI